MNSNLKLTPDPEDNPSVQPASSEDSTGSYTCDALNTVPLAVRLPAENATWKDTYTSQTTICQIKQLIAKDNIGFIRFEATDLHGISRSKMVPARHFQEKAMYGISMPRSFLELTLSPKNNEVDHLTAANFNSDVLLIPDLSTFRTLPWAKETARVICDSYSLTGHALRTSPRLVAKQSLSQLQNLGFSLQSSFTYECCIFNISEKINSKILIFPAATLMSNDLPFFQQLISNMYLLGIDVDSFATATGPGQIEISFRPESGIRSSDNAFTFRTGIKEIARKQGYVASFITNDGFYNSGIFSHSLWDANGKRNLFYSNGGELSEIGNKWLAGLLHHSAALSCLLVPRVACWRGIAKVSKETKHAIYATYGCNDNSCSFNVKFHESKGVHMENRLGSGMANPYIVLAATVAAGVDGIKQNLSIATTSCGNVSQQKQFAIPVKLEDALTALEEDHVIRGVLGDTFVQYFIAMKRYEIETELDTDREKCLEYFI